MNKFIIGTDGGAYKQKDGTFDSVAALRIYGNERLMYKEAILLKGKTNNYAEIYAIMRGLKAIDSYITVNKLKGSEVILITDSELCWKSLTEWIENWLRNTSDHILKNSENKPVINQEIIKMAYIYYLRLESKCKIKLCHINSHCSINDLDKNLKKFNKKNKTKFTIDEYEMLYVINDECDKMIEECYKDVKK